MALFSLALKYLFSGNALFEGGGTLRKGITVEKSWLAASHLEHSYVGTSQSMGPDARHNNRVSCVFTNSDFESYINEF